MNFEESREYIESLKGLGSCPGLDTIRELLRRLGNPQDDCQYVHISGTNGKGSILAFCLAILKSAGLKVGRYTSPAVFTWSESFCVGNRAITQDEYTSLVGKIKPVCDEMVKDGLHHPTYFEVETALAFLFFSQKKCDLVLLECGMGGEEDATNVVQNTLVAVFASIGLDHTDFLGDTLEKIATTKAGIIKPGAMVVSAPQEQEVSAVLKNRVDVSKYTEVNKKKIRSIKTNNEGQIFDYKDYKKLQTTMQGTYQLTNAATAVEVIEALTHKGYLISEAHIRKGLKTAKWSGRMETILDKPLILLDGAHNPHAFNEVMDSIDLRFTNRTLLLIIGMLKDKAYEESVSMIAPRAEMIFTVTPNKTVRALDGITLAETICAYNTHVTAMDSIKEAIDAAIMIAEAYDMDKTKQKPYILITGSLSHLGEAKGYIKKYYGR